jgi:hypothetical protein
MYIDVYELEYCRVAAHRGVDVLKEAPDIWA